MRADDDKKEIGDRASIVVVNGNIGKCPFNVVPAAGSELVCELDVRMVGSRSYETVHE